MCVFFILSTKYFATPPVEPAKGARDPGRRATTSNSESLGGPLGLGSPSGPETVVGMGDSPPHLASPCGFHRQKDTQSRSRVVSTENQSK